MGMSDKIEAFINELLKDVFRHKLITLFQQGLIPTTVTSSNQDEAAEVI